MKFALISLIVIILFDVAVIGYAFHYDLPFDLLQNQIYKVSVNDNK